MAFNYYAGLSEARLLALRAQMQEQLAAGRITEIRLAGESTRSDATNAPDPEITLERIAFALYRLYATGVADTVYENPQAQAGVTLQSFQ